jgi:DNA-binding transcriptional ArsR family regulator
MEDTGLSPRAISQAISRLEKHRLIQRMKKRGALPNRYRVLLDSPAPRKATKAKKPARASRRPAPTQVVKPSVSKTAVPRQKGTGRRRKDPRQLLQVEIPDLLEGISMDEDQPDLA